MDAPESTINSGADSCSLEGFDADVRTNLALMTPSRTTVADDTPCPIPSQWSTRTGWLCHLRGHDTKHLATLAELSYADESHLRRVCSAVERLLSTLHHGAQTISCPPSVLRILKSTKPDGIEVEPVIFDATSTTLLAYATHWKQFLCYVLRVITGSKPTLLSLSGTQLVMVQDILRCSSDEVASGADMEKMVFCFLADILEQPVTGWPFESPLLHFLAIHALKSGGLKLSSRSRFAPTLAAMSYVARLIVLEKGLPQASRSGNAFVLDWRAYHKKHLVDESLSAVSELLSLTKYATETAVPKNSEQTYQLSARTPRSHDTVQTQRPGHEILEGDGDHSVGEPSDPDSSTLKSARTTPVSFSTNRQPFDQRVARLSAGFTDARGSSPCKRPCDSVNQQSEDRPFHLTDLGSFSSTKRVRRNPSAQASSSAISGPGFHSHGRLTSRTAEAGRQFLTRIFHTLVQNNIDALCPVCWFEYGTSEAAHPFSSCTKTHITLAYVKWFTKNHLHWVDNCHFGCGTPRFVCGLYRGSCDYTHVLSSIILLALQSSAHRALFEQLFPEEPIGNEADIAAAITKPSVLYGTDVTIGIVFFDAVVKSTNKDRDPFLA